VSADELFKVHKLKPSQSWRHHFDNYLKTIPVYYAAVSAVDWLSSRPVPNRGSLLFGRIGIIKTIIWLTTNRI